MKNQISSFLVLCAVATVALRGVRVADAHQAVVVGVDSYAQLPEAQLNGAVIDAKTIAKQLQAGGFTTRVLTGKEATGPAIVAELEKLRARTKSDEAVLFYFAGMGGRDEKNLPVLLPADARPDGTKDLSIAVIDAAVRAIPAYSRLVVLDAGFSNVLTRGRALPDGSKLRFLTRPTLTKTEDARDLGELSNSEGVLPRALLQDARGVRESVEPMPDESVFYVTAAGWNGAALEGADGSAFSRGFGSWLKKLIAPVASAFLGPIGGIIGSLVGGAKPAKPVAGFAPQNAQGAEGQLWSALLKEVLGALSPNQATLQQPQIVANSQSALQNGWLGGTTNQKIDTTVNTLLTAYNAQGKKPDKTQVAALVQQSVMQFIAAKGGNTNTLSLSPQVEVALQKLLQQYGLAPAPATAPLPDLQNVPMLIAAPAVTMTPWQLLNTTLPAPQFLAMEVVGQEGRDLALVAGAMPFKVRVNAPYGGRLLVFEKREGDVYRLLLAQTLASTKTPASASSELLLPGATSSFALAQGDNARVKAVLFARPADSAALEAVLGADRTVTLEALRSSRSLIVVSDPVSNDEAAAAPRVASLDLNIVAR